MLGSGAANAAITVYTTQAAFLAAITGPTVDTYTGVPQTNIGSPVNRTAGAYSYQGTGLRGLFPGNVGGNVFMSTAFAIDPMGFVNFTGGAKAIGGNFFSSDVNGNFASSPQISVTFTDNSGSSAQTIFNPTTSSFLGFTTTGSIQSLVVTGFNPVNKVNFLWPSADNLTLGGLAAAVPEPQGWAMLIAGFGLTGAAMRRRARTVAA